MYLQPLIDEMKLLWDVGVNTYDAFKAEYFTLHAALLWTINDFPAYGNLSGWSVKGRLACPVCNKDTWSRYLPHWNKQCYMGHRRFLELDHKWRHDKKSFDNTSEMDPPPKYLSGEEVADQISKFENIKFGKVDGKRKRTKPKLVYNWEKKSIFFELPYWSKNLVRHNLDVIHIEKNICESILGTAMNIPGKTKDNLKSRLDLVEMGIRKSLHPKKVGDKYEIPKAAFELSLNERKDVCRFLADLKVPDGYSSNIGRCVNVNEGKITGTLKSRDCHIFMQDLLAPSFRGKFDKDVYDALVELSLFFKQLCSKALKVEVLERLEKSIAITLCKLERVFVPSFFDIMVHLTVHLATEAKLAGPVQYRWMYPFER